jgi:hypothetical protein
MGLFGKRDSEAARLARRALRKADNDSKEYWKEFSPFLNVASAIYQAAFSCEKGIDYSRGDPERDRTVLPMKVYFEFLFFFLHLTDRMALSAFGDSRRVKFLNIVTPIVLTLSIDYWFDVPVEKKKEMRAGLSDEFKGNATRYYGAATEWAFEENPIGGDTVVSRLGQSVAEMIGSENDPGIMFQAAIAVMKELGSSNLHALVKATGTVIDNFEPYAIDPWDDPNYSAGR